MEKDRNGDITYTFRTSHLDDAKKQVTGLDDFRIEGDIETHNNILNESPVEIPAPGLREIKQRELFKKWRPFVPKERRDSICPKPHFMIEEEEEKKRQKAQKALEQAEKAAENQNKKRKAIDN